jgi:hypothetical protein
MENRGLTVPTEEEVENSIGIIINYTENNDRKQIQNNVYLFLDYVGSIIGERIY